MENELKVVRIRLVDDPPFYANEQVKNPNQVVKFLAKDLALLDRELFGVLNLSTRGHVINMNVVSIGTLNSCVINPREVFKSSILSNAASIVLFHNHPSKDTTPSKEDIIMTKRLVESGALIGIPIVDHIILGGETYLSMKEQGVLPRAPAYDGAVAEGKEPYHAESTVKISFYVAVCMEFPSLGNVYKCQSMESAVKQYQNLPESTKNMGNGIGFTIEDKNNTMYSGDFELMSGKLLDIDTLNSISYYRDSPLVQKAVGDIRRLMPDLEVIEEITRTRLPTKDKIR